MLLLNNAPVRWFNFPGGEIQVKLPEEIPEESCVLTWMPKDPSSIVLLQLTINAMKHAGIHDIILDCLYLPYGRQDRVCSPGEAFSLEVICNMLNALTPLTMIRFWDTHNWDKTVDLMGNHYLFEMEEVDIFAKYKILDHFDLYKTRLCAPDHGAINRVEQIVKHFELMTPTVYEKNRNPESGLIEGIKLNKYFCDPNGDSILVVDDICDGGSTFIHLAEALKKDGAENLYLYVTHGIFSKGVSELLKHYKHIYCHHVFHPLLNDHDGLTVLRKFDV
jgi:ribose-phosphate pyrophosphokinase